MLRSTLGRYVAALKHGRAFLLILLAMLLAACESSLGGNPAPQKYSCGDHLDGHCYAVGRIGNRIGGRLSGHLTGFRSTITVVGRFVPGDGLVTNEFWLVNDNDGGVVGWIEVGYVLDRFEQPPMPKYVLAVKDPDFGALVIHDIGFGPIPQEEINTGVVFDIHQTAEDTFVVSVDGSKTHFSETVHANLWDGTKGGFVQLGQELQGTSGVVASFATFVDNQVYDQHFQRRFATEGDGPSEEVGKPPYGGWMQLPTAGKQGGVFSTYCCAP
jgi:hypothetical protein